MPDQEIQLNKPLYKPATQEAAAQFAFATSFSRGAALVLDVMLLHVLALGIIRLMPNTVLALGPAGPWVGLAAGLAYFIAGNSHITGGRTIGKMLLRIEVRSTSGAYLGLSESAVRVASLAWPVVVYLAVRTWVEGSVTAETLPRLRLLPDIAVAFAAGWVGGNAMYMGAEPHRRTWHDRRAGSAVLLSDSAEELRAEYLGDVRAGTAPAQMRRPRLLLITGMVILGGLSLVRFGVEQREWARRNPDQRALVVEQYAVFMEPGFPLTLLATEARNPDAAAAETAAADGGTTAPGVTMRLRRRGTIDPRELGERETVRSRGARLGDVYPRIVRSFVEQGLSGARPPDEVRMEVSYATFADLLFARAASDIVRTPVTIDLRSAVEAFEAKQAAHPAEEPAATGSVRVADRATTETP